MELRSVPTMNHSRKFQNKDGQLQDGNPWPGNNVKDHHGMIQVFLEQTGVRDLEGNELPCHVYVFREKRPRFDHTRELVPSMLWMSIGTRGAKWICCWKGFVG